MFCRCFSILLWCVKEGYFLSLPTFLQDRRFLKELDTLRIKEQFVKITVLNWQEEPLQEVQGQVISGSINLVGNSSMRRTATLSIFAEEKDNNLETIDSLFAINKKCKIELGIRNTVAKYVYNKMGENGYYQPVSIDYQTMYGDIVWFPLGVYIMFNPSISHSLTGVTISMNLKDKMCLLSGELGGVIHSSVDFKSMDQVVDAVGTVTQKDTLVYDIIKQLVHHWGNEDLANIVISGVPLKIKQVMKWMGQTPAWIIENSLGATMYIYLTQAQALQAYNRISVGRRTDPSIPELNLRAVHPGQALGFIYVDFTYPAKQFFCNAGQTVTSMLDKIVNMLGNFEYFYDVEGKFVFQQIQNYLNTSNTATWVNGNGVQTGYLPSDIYQADSYRLSKNVYDFTYNELVVGYNNTLNYNNLKNDFVIWGSRKTTNGNAIPVRFHLAIDVKPQLGIHNLVLYRDNFGCVRGSGYRPMWDGMSDDQIIGLELFPNSLDENAKGKIISVIKNRQSIDWREEIYYQMLEDELLGTGTSTERNNSYFQYYAELKEEFPKIFDLRRQVDRITELEEQILHYEGERDSLESQGGTEDMIDYYNNIISELREEIQYISSIPSSSILYNQACGWVDEVVYAPEQINYFLDFIDEDSQIGMYSVGNIGRRAYVVEDNQNLNCVFEPAIPDVVYIDTTQPDASEIQSLCEDTGQTWAQIDNYLRSLLTQSGNLNSCFEKAKDLLYQYTHITNTVSITTLPIYYLEPNTRIKIEDDASSIHGDFIIQSISLPLDINSTMTISAYQAEQKI